MKNKNKSLIILGSLLLAYLFLMIGLSLGMINSYFSGVIVAILINVIMTSSLTLVTGYLGELVLGHAGFMAVGAS